MKPYKLLMYQEEVCNEAEHHHEVPLQKMARVKVLDQVFDVTLDGESFNARASDTLEASKLSMQGLLQFIIYCLLKARG